MSVQQRTSQPEAFALARAIRESLAELRGSIEGGRISNLRESFAEWFSQPPRVTTPSMLFEEPPEMILVREEGELAPTTAGAMAGAVAGPLTLGIAMMLAGRAHHAVDVAGVFGAVVTGGAAAAPWSSALGWTLSIVGGAMIGAVFGFVTRRLRSFPPMILFGAILSAATWTAVHGLALPRLTPSIAHTLPYGPMVIAAALFGALLACQVPIRTRRLL